MKQSAFRLLKNTRKTERGARKSLIRLANAAPFALLFALPLAAHMVSMSTGDLKVDGAHASYELRMPMYEVAHVHDPQHTLLDHVRFESGGAWGKASDEVCRQEQDTYVCTAEYQFPAPVETLQVECTLASVTVPNHVHLLRAYRGDKTDQAVFDLSYTQAEIRFRPPTAFETATREISAGFMRAAGGLAPLLFLVSLVLAARSRRELIALTASFIAAETLACAIAPRIVLSLSPRFIEAAAALTIAYLAFEIILLPHSGMRWLVVAVLGLFHGAYFAAFLTESGYHLAPFLTGVVICQLLLIALFAFLLDRLVRLSFLRRAVPVAASLLLAVGVAWFVLRLRA
ncbi:MAG: HupE/UreJ family protein [Bryobacteraceae bacterium]